jgi:CheY-like chemotaxis protein
MGHPRPTLIVPTATSVTTLSTSQESAAAESLVFSFSALTAAPRLVYVLENDRISSVITELIVKKNLSGGEVRCYPNGRVAFNDLAAAVRTNSEVPDLVLLDLDMPLMDGWEFLDALNGLPAAHAVCVFVLTSSIHPDDLARATSYRAVNGFFTKPLDEDSIIRMQFLLQEQQTQAIAAALAPVAVAIDAMNYPQAPPLGLPSAGALQA